MPKKIDSCILNDSLFSLAFLNGTKIKWKEEEEFDNKHAKSTKKKEEEKSKVFPLCPYCLSGSMLLNVMS